MPNKLQRAYNTVQSRILSKTVDYSIAKEDVGNTDTEFLSLAVLFPVADPNDTYPKDWLVRDASYNLFICLVDDASGDTTNGANWRQVAGTTSGSVDVFDVPTTSVSNAYTGTNAGVLAYATNKVYVVTPDTPCTDNPTFRIGSLTAYPIKKAVGASYVNAMAGDFSSTSILLFRTSFFLLVNKGGDGGNEITDPTLVSLFSNDTNWSNSPVGSKWSYVGSLTNVYEHDYMIVVKSVFGSSVQPIYRIDILKINGVLTPIRTQLYFF